MYPVTCIIEETGKSGVRITRTFQVSFVLHPQAGDEIRLTTGHYQVVRRVWDQGFHLTIYLQTLVSSLDFSLTAE